MDVFVNPTYSNFFNSFIFKNLESQNIVVQSSISSFKILKPEFKQDILLDFNDWTSVIRDEDGNFTYLSFAPLNLTLKIKSLKSGIIFRDIHETLNFASFSKCFNKNTFWCVSRKNNSLLFRSYDLSINDLESAFNTYCSNELP